jgi:SHS2 domain-containing protein
MKSKDFEFLEHTADLKFLARGKTLEECFQNSAKAMFSGMLNLDLISPNIEKRMKIESPDLETLLHDFLSELLFFFETSQLVFKNFNMKIKKKHEKYFLEALVKGEKFNPRKHGEIHTEIKAVTYHDLFVKKNEAKGEWSAEVLCDI